MAPLPAQTVVRLPAPPAGACVRVRVPASTANLGPGFDSMGMALGLWDEYAIRVLSQPVVEVLVRGEGAGELPTTASHLVIRSMMYAWHRLGIAAPAGLRLEAVNAVPQSRGLGSSATAIVGGVVAAQALSALGADVPAPGEPVEFDRDITNTLAAQLEGHPDNSSASVYGGATISWTESIAGRARTRTARLPIDPRIEAVCLVPSLRLPTSTARAALPPVVDHDVAAANSGRAALLALALTGRPDLLLAATEDRLHQEFRRMAYPATMAVVDELRGRGLAACVSGAGPSVLVLTERDRIDQVRVDERHGRWDRLVPGIPDHGALAWRGED